MSGHGLMGHPSYNAETKMTMLQQENQRPERERQILNFVLNLKKVFQETLALINEAYEDEKLSRTQVYFWYEHFKDGRKSIADDLRSGRP
ncbi:GVQW3 [Cordylochernes scorpioides]|uniref:GVQW3 n=1 Tax=Cordylochernes scorpioides TaxID=51811 RepID=A0ABY6KBB3_9ARAC|nr:GVQW3 [Cordylochernes scorpioides]